MTAKTIEETIINKKTIYVSVDGKEWENELDCKEWEKGVKCVAEMAWNDIPKIEVEAHLCGLPDVCDTTAYIIKARNYNDVIALNNYIRTKVNINYDDYNVEINKPYIVHFGYDYDWCDIFNAEKYIEVIQNYIFSMIAKID